MPLVRVAVHARDAAATVSLPTELPIRELLPSIVATLTGQVDDDDRPTATAAVEEGQLRGYALSRIGEPPFSSTATLDTVGVLDGDLLLLRQVPPGEPAGTLIEDIADAAAIYSDERFAPWSPLPGRPHTMLRRTAAGAAVAGIVFFTGFWAWWWDRHDHHIQHLAGLGALTALCIAATLVAQWRRAEPAAAYLSIVTVAPLAVAGAAIVPGGFGAPRLFAAVSLAACWSVLTIITPGHLPAVHAGVVTFCIGLAGVSGARILWHLPPATLGAGLAVYAFLLAALSPTWAAGAARFPLPTVPAPGEQTPGLPSPTVLGDLPRRVQLAGSLQNGIVAGSVLSQITATVLLLWLPDQPGVMSWWVAGATGLVTVLRMRSWDSAVCGAWFLLSPLATAMALTASFAATGHGTAALYAAAGVGLYVAVTLTAAAASAGWDLSMPMRHALDLIEAALLVTLLPAMAWLTGILALIRNR
jgi:type VII secretion integral membrane protein EccD